MYLHSSLFHVPGSTNVPGDAHRRREFLQFDGELLHGVEHFVGQLKLLISLVEVCSLKVTQSVLMPKRLGKRDTQSVSLTFIFTFRLSAKSVKEGWKKFKSHIFNRKGGNGNGSGSNNNSGMSGAASCNDFEGVSTAPMPPNGTRLVGQK